MSRRKVRDVMTSNVVSEADLLAKVEFADGPDEPRLFEGRRHRTARQKADGTVAGELMSGPVVTIGAEI